MLLSLTIFSLKLYQLSERPQAGDLRFWPASLPVCPIPKPGKHSTAGAPAGLWPSPTGKLLMPANPKRRFACFCFIGWILSCTAAVFGLYRLCWHTNQKMLESCTLTVSPSIQKIGAAQILPPTFCSETIGLSIFYKAEKERAACSVNCSQRRRRRKEQHLSFMWRTTGLRRAPLYLAINSVYD